MTPSARATADCTQVARKSHLRWIGRRHAARIAPACVAIAHPMALGDVVACLPLAGALKTGNPGTRVIFIGSRYSRALIEACVHVDDFLDVEEVLREPQRLRALAPEAFVNPFPHRRLARLACDLGIPLRIGNLRRPASLRYCNRFVYVSRVHTHEHTVRINFRYLAPLGLAAPAADADLYPLFGLRPQQPLAEPLRRRLCPRRFNLVLHPGSGGEGREWPLQRYRELVERLPAEEFRVFVTGVGREGADIRRDCPQLLALPAVVDLTGQLELGQLISFLAAADGIVASGTGPLHIAAALGRHALGLFPPRRDIDPQRWAPIGPRADSLCRGGRCRPSPRTCSESGRGPPCACMWALSAEAVATRVRGWRKPPSGLPNESM